MMQVKDHDEGSDTLFIASKYGNITAIEKGGGDQYNTNFFKSLRLQMGATEVTEPYKQHVWTFACIKSLANAISSVPFVVVRETKQKSIASFYDLQLELRSLASEKRHKVTMKEISKRGFEIIKDGELFNTFQNINPVMSKSQLWEATIILYSLYGTCYWVLDNGEGEPIKSVTDWPSHVWPFSPKGWEARVTDDGVLEGWKRKYSFKNRDIEKNYDMFQVLKFYQYNPYDVLQGLGTYDVVKTAAEQDYKAMKYNEALLDNGGEPGGIIKVPGSLKKEQRDQLLAAWEDRHKGPSKAGRTALLMSGAEFDRNPMTPQDMEYQAGRKWNRDETFAAYRVPKQLASVYDDINFATAKIQLRQFWDQTAIPLMVYIEDQINSKLMSKATIAKGHYCMFDLSAVTALREDLETKSKTAQALSTVGIPTADIIDLLDINVKKRSWQAVWWVPMGMVPAGEVPAEETPPEGAAQEPEQTETTQKLTHAISKLQREIEKEKHWNIWVTRVLNPVEKPFQSRMKTFWYDLRKEQLKRWFDGTKSVRSIPNEAELNAILFNNKEWGEKIKKVAKPFLLNSAKLSLELVSDELGLDLIPIADPRIASILMAKENKVTKITQLFWESLRGSIKEGIDANESVGDIASRIKDLFNNAASPSRTMTIARTETAQTASEVRHAAFKIDGVKKHEWSTSQDEKVRSDHVRLGDTGSVSVEHNYMSDLGKGGTLMFPSDMRGPADQVINCIVDENCPIITLNGNKKISEVLIGDFVFTHNRRYRRVVRVRPDSYYTGNIVSFRAFNREIRVTAGHPFKTLANWNRADRLKSGNLVQVSFCATNIEQAEFIEDRMSKFGYCISNKRIPLVLSPNHWKESDEFRASLLDFEIGQKKEADNSACSSHSLISMDGHPVFMSFNSSVGMFVNNTKLDCFFNPFKNRKKSIGDYDSRIRFGKSSRFSDSNTETSVCIGESSNIRKVNGSNHIYNITCYVEINKIFIEKKKDIRVWNFAVKDDESYIANNFVSHNCRCVELPII
jgi:HK97 family phage portal protein